MIYTPKHRILINKPDQPYLDIYIIRDFGNQPKLLTPEGYREVPEGFEFDATLPSFRIPTVDQTEMIALLIKALQEQQTPVMPFVTRKEVDDL